MNADLKTSAKNISGHKEHVNMLTSVDKYDCHIAVLFIYKYEEKYQNITVTVVL